MFGILVKGNIFMLYNDKEFIGKVIKNARKRVKMTQAELAEKINMSEKNIGNIENGKQFPQVDNFLRLIEELNISLEEFGVKSSNKVSETQEELIRLILNSTEETNKKYLETVRFINNIIE